jgi:hypothetical protein
MNDGSAFESAVLEVLKLLPNAIVSPLDRKSGKVADIFLEVKETARKSPRRIAVECKDYSKPLSRLITAGIISEYRPLLDQGTADSFILVTRNGIVPNAGEMFDGDRFRHLRYSDLLAEVLDLAPLVQDMLQIFQLDGLDQYYEPVICEDIDLTLLARNYDLAFNPFMDFAVHHYGERFVDVADTWIDKLRRGSYGKSVSEKVKPMLNLPSRYTTRSFNSLRRARRPQGAADLEALVKRWVLDQESECGIALLGSYGTGKSTFAKRFASVCATMYIDGELDRVPLLIELRNFTTDHDIDYLITHELANRHGVESASFTRFQRLNEAGRFVIILDGFDEMKHGMSRSAMVHSFSQLNRLSTGASKVLLCGRPTAFENEDEQNELLGASAESPMEHTARYIPVNVLPTPSDRILPLAEGYASAKGMLKDPQMRMRLDKLGDELDVNPRIRDLLSRPVHIPMLLRVLPSLEVSLSELTRSRLYGTFVDQTIRRESEKRRHKALELKDGQRLEFAARLACEMLRRGDARSIAISAIPESLIERFRPRRYSHEVVKRELVAACFLEVKAPEILYFGHKSYCEYLAALGFHLTLQSERDTDTLGVKPTQEVASFIAEIFSALDWAVAFRNHSGNSRLLRTVIKAAFRSDRPFIPEGSTGMIASDFLVKQARAQIDAPSGVIAPDLLAEQSLTQIDKVRNQISPHVLSEFAEMVERVSKRFAIVDPMLTKLLLKLIEDRNDFVAVHAYRALPTSNLPTETELEKLFGKERYEYWSKRDWLRRDEVEQ